MLRCSHVHRSFPSLAISGRAECASFLFPLMNNPIGICRSSEAIFAQTGNSLSVYIIRKTETLVKSDNGVSTIQCLTPSPPGLLPPRWRSLRNSLQRPSQQYIVLNPRHCCDDHSGVNIPLVRRDQYECNRQEREILHDQRLCYSCHSFRFLFGFAVSTPWRHGVLCATATVRRLLCGSLFDVSPSLVPDKAWSTGVHKWSWRCLCSTNSVTQFQDKLLFQIATDAFKSAFACCQRERER